MQRYNQKKLKKGLTVAFSATIIKSRTLHRMQQSTKKERGGESVGIGRTEESQKTGKCYNE